MSLSCSLRSSSNWRLVDSELHLDTRFEIYGSTIGVRILVCYIPLCQQFNAAIQEQIPTLQLGSIGNRRLGVLTGAERMTPPGIQAQRPRTRTARTTRQINGAIRFWYTGWFWDKCHPLRPDASYVPTQKTHLEIV